MGRPKKIATEEIENATVQKIEEVINKADLNEEEHEKVVKSLSKVHDVWAKHNLGTRFLVLTFGICFLIVVIASAFGVTFSSLVVNMVFYSAVLCYIATVVGHNAVEKILAALIKIKLK